MRPGGLLPLLPAPASAACLAWPLEPALLFGALGCACCCFVLLASCFVLRACLLLDPACLLRPKVAPSQPCFVLAVACASCFVLPCCCAVADWRLASWPRFWALGGCRVGCAWLRLLLLAVVADWLAAWPWLRLRASWSAVAAWCWCCGSRLWKSRWNCGNVEMWKTLWKDRRRAWRLAWPWLRLLPLDSRSCCGLAFFLAERGPSALPCGSLCVFGPSALPAGFWGPKKAAFWAVLVLACGAGYCASVASAAVSRARMAASVAA